MKRIVLLPLDERPCNFRFPKELFDNDEFQICRPNVLGDKKTPANVEDIQSFMEREVMEADGMVIAMDTLLYGGLIPSRLHQLSEEEVCRRMDIIRNLRKKNPKLKIFAFLCIMRCPKRSSNDEEPDYYEYYGAQIHQLGACIHRRENGEIGSELDAKEAKLREEIPEADYLDYINRREANCKMNLRALDLVGDGTIDFMVIPQDDSAPFGYTAMDQAKVRYAVRDKNLQQKVLIYPGADEVAMTLLARMYNEYQEKKPAVFVQYASEEAAYVIPSYEDRPFGESLKSHIWSAGCRRVYTSEEADFILAVTAPGGSMLSCRVQPHLHLDYDVKRNLPELIDQILWYMEQGKPVAICDNAYGNGGDLELLQMLNSNYMLDKVAGYAGWNTSANTLGTVLAEAVCFLYRGRDLRHLNFLALRYVEDCGYCSVVKLNMLRNDLESIGMDYFNVYETDGQAAEIATEQMKDFVIQYLSSIAKHIQVDKVRMPWRRMFEADVYVKYVESMSFDS
ncbi:MAG: DUF4127 family protein [Eubacteriales bacterium]